MVIKAVDLETFTIYWRSGKTLLDATLILGSVGVIGLVLGWLLSRWQYRRALLLASHRAAKAASAALAMSISGQFDHVEFEPSVDESKLRLLICDRSFTGMTDEECLRVISPMAACLGRLMGLKNMSLAIARLKEGADGYEPDVSFESDDSPDFS